LRTTSRDAADSLSARRRHLQCHHHVQCCPLFNTTAIADAIAVSHFGRRISAISLARERNVSDVALPSTTAQLRENVAAASASAAFYANPHCDLRATHEK